MSKQDVQRIGAVAKRIVEVLSESPGGLTFPSLVGHMSPTTPLSNGARARADEEIRRGAIAMIKAGWVVDERGRWAVSEEGERAHARFSDPERFIREAARHSIKGWLSLHSPAYIRIAKNVEKFTVEYKAIRRIGLRQVFGNTLRTAPWQDVLPLQKQRRLNIPDVAAQNFDELREYFKGVGVSFAEGGHAIYLSPSALSQTAFRVLAEHYPPDAGLKIIKKPGGATDSTYAQGMTMGDSHLHLKLIHPPEHLALVANLFFSKNVGPRLHDFVELQCKDQLWTAYVLAHVTGRTPTVAECEAGVGKLRELEEQRLVRVLLPEGFNDPEFECPSCSNNALVDESGRFHYVDFQNFLLVNYEAYLTGIAREAGAASHFGEKTILRGGRYLYQSVPGVNLPGKRSIDDRLVVLRRLMEEAGVSVEDRLVLDVGCNIGMMMGQYLKLGAKWCHGWDRVRVTEHTERLLLALGCTRFSTTGCDISRDQPLEENIPPFLKSALDGCVISYLAVRGHIGWLDALARIPWSFIVYEGHEGETQEDFEEHISEFRAMTNFKVGGLSYYTDGDSDQRPVAILVRQSD